MIYIFSCFLAVFQLFLAVFGILSCFSCFLVFYPNCLSQSLKKLKCFGFSASTLFFFRSVFLYV